MAMWRATLFTLQASLLSSCLTACTGQLPNSFRYLQQEQSFTSQQEVNTKIDLLWVVDNSASMDVAQSKLRVGFEGFARKYMQPTWDIRVAVITTDTYMAHSAFSGYLAQTISGSIGWKSTHIYNRLSTFENPSWNPTLVNLTTGFFDSGIKYGELVPLWGADYARLLPGIHDGPITAFCLEAMPYFMKSVTQCAIRDDQTLYQGTEKCLTPDEASGESSLSQCVNTVENDTVRSGRAIIETMPPDDTEASETWTAELVNNFIVNVSTGSSGQGSERGLASVLQLLRDNEGTETAFFRQDTLRGILFVTDEEDQSLQISEDSGDDFTPRTDYKCDQASLLSWNSASKITGTNGYCCSDPAQSCMYGSAGTSCPAKTVDDTTYTISVCPDESKLIAVSDVKDEIDLFFRTLDGDPEGDPGYFVVSILPLTASSIQTLQAARNESDTAVGTIETFAVDRGDRYLELGELVGNGSLAMDINEPDYSTVLEAIGRAIIEKKSTFTLEREPTSEEDMIVTLVHSDGSSEEVSSSIYVIEGNSLIITDQDYILGLQATDTITISYQPKRAY